MSTRGQAQSITRIIVNGAPGRMGARLCALAIDDPLIELVGAVAREGSTRLGDPVPGSTLKFVDLRAFSSDFDADAVIDFSSNAGACEACAIAIRARCALLVGTTGLAPTTIKSLRTASSTIPVLVAPNTSMGVATVAALVSKAAKLLGPGFQCSITEAHHIAKKDAPSGTALRLADAAREGGAEVPPNQILSIRGGDVVGEHTVRFAGPGEYIELTHRATSRDLFARGALTAATWLRERAPGWYTMNDVLGLPAR